MYWSRGLLKQNAKQVLRESYWRVFLAWLLITLGVGAASSVLSYIIVFVPTIILSFVAATSPEAYIAGVIILYILMLVFIHLGKMDTRHAAGGVKVINLASNIGGVCSALMAGTVVLGVGLAAALASILGHYLGAGLAIRNGSKIVRPAVVVVLLLLLVKVISELLFPNFWN